MKSLKTFTLGGTGVTVSPGVEFDTSSAKARYFEMHGMAVPMHAVANVAEAKEPPRPLSRAGGPIGEATPSSSSDPAPAPRKRRYTKRAAKQDS